jgi:hypothetical protein
MEIETTGAAIPVPGSYEFNWIAGRAAALEELDLEFQTQDMGSPKPKRRNRRLTAEGTQDIRTGKLLRHCPLWRN